MDPSETEHREHAVEPKVWSILKQAEGCRNLNTADTGGLLPDTGGECMPFSSASGSVTSMRRLRQHVCKDQAQDAARTCLFS